MLQQGTTNDNQDYRTQDQQHYQLHQSKTCTSTIFTSSYTIKYINLQYVHSATPSITPVYNMYSQLHNQLNKSTTCTSQLLSQLHNLQHVHLVIQKYRTCTGGSASIQELLCSHLYNTELYYL